MLKSPSKSSNWIERIWNQLRNHEYTEKNPHRNGILGNTQRFYELGPLSRLMMEGSTLAQLFINKLTPLVYSAYKSLSTRPPNQMHLEANAP
jgi:hypothetical protein